MSGGRYRAYPQYKNSGLEWASLIPLHWDHLSLRWTATLYAGGTPSKDREDYWENGIVPWINSGAVNQNLITEPSTYISHAAFSNSSAKWIPKGALVMALAGQGKTKGMVARLGIDTTCNQSMAAIVPSDIRFADYLFWWLASNYENIRNLSGGDNRDGLNLEILGGIQCPRPPVEEQIQITQFLDHETAKIDRLIEKQEELIRLLKEKRQAVISHAVTKGINPHVPLKDSGIPWLGQVPAHWTVSKIKHVAEVESGHTPDKKVEAYWVNCDIPWVSLNDSTQLKQVDYISDTAFYLNEKGIANSSARKLPARAVIFTRDASIGLSAITTRQMAVSQHIIAWICDPEKVIPEYLLLVFYAMAGELERYTFGATIKTIGMADVNTLVGAFPPLDEQKLVIDHVFALKARLSDAVTLAEKLVGTLQERRTALVSAAVTGKIDVRNWRPPAIFDSEMAATKRRTSPHMETVAPTVP